MQAHKLQCAQIWGGIDAGAATVTTSGLNATLFASSGQGDKGGDIYYFSLCNSDYITRVALADVVGHGESVSKISQSLYDSLGRHVDNPNGHDVLVYLNEDAIKKGVSAITTGIVATYYRANKTLSYAYAGHPPMLLNRNNETDWTELLLDFEQQTGVANIPLAVDEDAIYNQDTIDINCGDRVLLYTDGLLETRSNDDEPFGMDRLRTILKNNGEKEIDVLRDTLTNALYDHAGGKLDQDDVTLLLLQIN